MRSPTKSFALQIKKYCNPVWSLRVRNDRNTLSAVFADKRKPAFEGD